jgi:hypothetical protein
MQQCISHGETVLCNRSRAFEGLGRWPSVLAVYDIARCTQATPTETSQKCLQRAHGRAVGVPLVTVGVALLEERLMLLPHKLLELRTLDARFSLLAAGNT